MIAKKNEMKTLAFLIDGIENLKELIRFAALLGKNINAKIQILHIQYPHVYGTHGYMGTAIASDPEQHQKITNEVKGIVTGFIQELKTKIDGIPPIDFKSDIGDATVILKEKVENNVYDMVMLQGNTELSFWLQDSVIMDVVRNVHCPVWIIPPDARFKPLKKIIYATDYNEEDITTLKRLIDLTKPFDPEIMALHLICLMRKG
jgi:nucleotide-binding universal stress UspA family protein